jgi:hypothetical protein
VTAVSRPSARVVTTRAMAARAPGFSATPGAASIASRMTARPRTIAATTPSDRYPRARVRRRARNTLPTAAPTATTYTTRSDRLKNVIACWARATAVSALATASPS